MAVGVFQLLAFAMPKVPLSHSHRIGGHRISGLLAYFLSGVTWFVFGAGVLRSDGPSADAGWRRVGRSPPERSSGLAGAHPHSGKTSCLPDKDAHDWGASGAFSKGMRSLSQDRASSAPADGASAEALEWVVEDVDAQPQRGRGAACLRPGCQPKW